MSDAENRIGTIFMGPSSDREATIDKVTEKQQHDIWNRRTEAEYMERVRLKATARVQAMLEQARVQAETIRGTARQYAEKVKADSESLYTQAEQSKQEADEYLAEAKSQRENAQGQGYADGMEQAREAMEQHQIAIEDATASVLKTIEEQSHVLFSAWRQDLVDLLKDAVTSVTGWLLSEERSAILDSLLDSAVRALSDHRHIHIRSHPKDYEAVRMVIDSAKSRYTDLQTWDVVQDESISAGGLVVESESGVADNRINIRRQIVDEILQHLDLPAGSADQEAENNIDKAMQETGMNELAVAADARAEMEMQAMQTDEQEEPIVDQKEEQKNDQLQSDQQANIPSANPEVTQATANSDLVTQNDQIDSQLAQAIELAAPPKIVAPLLQNIANDPAPQEDTQDSLILSAPSEEKLAHAIAADTKPNGEEIPIVNITIPEPPSSLELTRMLDKLEIQKEK